MRELLSIELQDLLSKLVKLMGEFRDENDYDNTMKHIKKENANDIRT
jgi:hypothetical protein